MKVSNQKTGGPSGKVDSAKSSRADSAKALNKDVKADALSTSKNAKGIKEGAKVDVSERAQMMQRAKELAGGEMSVDEAKVARLQKLIDEGKYKVDADKISDRLVDEHLLIPD
jgi:flagellar biosynthesis anti-sigma factor FlgM